MSALEITAVEPQRRAAVAIDRITSGKREWSRANRRPRALTAREALLALQFESLFVYTFACNLNGGVPMTVEDRERLALACRRIDTIANEAAG